MVTIRVKPDHRVLVRMVRPFDVMNSTSGYFDGYTIFKPFAYLSASPYAPLLDIYESLRVTKIVAHFYLTGVSAFTTGVTAGMYFKDIVPTQPNRYYEQLVEEPGHKRGRALKAFTFTWTPIEPHDYDFYDHAQAGQMDDGRYGQINFAGVALSNPDAPKSLIEFVVSYDFKSLKKPTVPRSLAYGDEDDEVFVLDDRPAGRLMNQASQPIGVVNVLHSTTTRPSTGQTRRN